MKQRRPSTVAERMTPCECCGYPVSERHHLVPIAAYGENPHTAQLCANCHELYHILERRWSWLSVCDSADSERLLAAIAQHSTALQKRMTYLTGLVGHARTLKDGCGLWSVA